MPLTSGVAGDYPATYNTLLTTTTQLYKNTLVDNISEAIPTWWWLNKKGRKKYDGSGESIFQPLMYKLNTVQSFDGLEKLETTPKEGLSPAVFLYKQYQTSLVIPKQHLRMNSGSKEKILNILQAQMEQAEISFRDKMNEDVILGTIGRDPTGLEGLAAIIGTPLGGAPTTYGGISSSTYAWWAPQTDAIATGFATDGIDSWRNLYFSCCRGNDKPDLILVTEAMYKLYEKSQVGAKRYANTDAMDAGFTNILYHGATVIFDRDLPANGGYFLNSKYLNLCVDKEVEFESDEWRYAHDRWGLFTRIFWRGNLTCSNRARQGYLSGLGDTDA